MHALVRVRKRVLVRMLLPGALANTCITVCIGTCTCTCACSFCLSRGPFANKEDSTAPVQYYTCIESSTRSTCLVPSRWVQHPFRI